MLMNIVHSEITVFNVFGVKLAGLNLAVCVVFQKITCGLCFRNT
jgi:hypothetical protein